MTGTTPNKIEMRRHALKKLEQASICIYEASELLGNPFDENDMLNRDIIRENGDLVQRLHVLGTRLKSEGGVE